jgi:hypothetical protein
MKQDSQTRLFSERQGGTLGHTFYFKGISPLCESHVLIFYFIMQLKAGKGKDKAIPLQAWTGL